MNATDPFADDLAAALALTRMDKRAGFAGLYNLCAPRVMAYLHRFKLPLQTREDLLANTWLRAMDRFEEFQERNFLSWLFTIAHNLAKDSYRKLNVRREVPLDAVPTTPAATDPLKILTDEETRQRLQSCLQGLTDDQLHLVLVRYREGLNGDALMAKLGITARGTLDSRHGRAVAALKKCMESAEEKPPATGADQRFKYKQRRGEKP